MASLSAPYLPARSPGYENGTSHKRKVRAYVPHNRRGPSFNADCQLMRKIDRVLSAMFRAGRRSVSVVDVDCGDGTLLLHTVLRAPELGFVAIEATGLDCELDRLANARDAARGVSDPAMGLSFDLRVRGEPLPIIEDGDSDLTLVAGAAKPGLATEIDRVTCRGGRRICH